MNNIEKEKIVQSAIGSGKIDAIGSAIGVSRMDVEKSYKNIDLLLQKVIRDSDEQAWQQVITKINYIYKNLDFALSALNQEIDFLSDIKKRLNIGQKILFKPNLVSMENISPHDYGPTPASNAITEWPFVAAVLRWFHDKAGISYYKMCIGEAATSMGWSANHFSHIKKEGRKVTTEAAIEGRSDDFYGGWGFYFLRKYLSEEADPTIGDNPMNGLEESMAGTYLPPGAVKDKLMVYDLNQISDDSSKGREISVPDGENFKTMTLHKVIVGGDPSDSNDRSLYPGSIIINLPKPKVHTQSLFTNAIKNIGIGLYPMQASNSKHNTWKYANPDIPVPGLKGTIPHQIWIPELDPETCIPRKDSNSNYIVKKTGGLTATMLDVFKALNNQDLYIMHIVDSIEAINRDHQGIGLGIKVPEGLAIASKDPVAIDLFCARYLFSNVGLLEAKEAGIDDGIGGYFPQVVAVPRFDGQNIITEKGYDCPIKRDYCLEKAEKAGFGVRRYYVVGLDGITNCPLASFQGRLGYIQNKIFNEIHTKTLYSDIYKLPWDLQKTFFEYLDIIDQIEGTSLKKEFLEVYDEDGDGIVSYEEYGKKGLFGSTMYLTGLYQSSRGNIDESEVFRTMYTTLVSNFRCTHSEWNPNEHDLYKGLYLGSVTVVAQIMSQSPKEMKDPFYSNLTWGNGKWPSFSLASNTYIHQYLYGWRYPKQVSGSGLYSIVFGYADYNQNDRKFIGTIRGVPNPNAIQEYVDAVQNGQMDPLDFIFYVPPGFGANGKFPNIQETSDPKKILTAEFEQGKIKWPDNSIETL